MSGREGSISHYAAARLGKCAPHLKRIKWKCDASGKNVFVMQLLITNIRKNGFQLLWNDNNYSKL